MKSVIGFGVILVVAMGLSWVRYTGGEQKEREGIVLLDGKKDEIQSATFVSPDLTVTYEQRKDDLGSYGWVVVSEVKKKKLPVPDKPGEFTESSETKVTKFKAGSAADKLVESLAPLMALRELEAVAADKLLSFGLTEPDSSFVLKLGGQERSLQLGGETYGTKDRYVKDASSGKIFIVDDEVFKPMKFANTRLPERGLTDLKLEQITSATLSQGASVVAWAQKNKDDKAAAFWERDGATPAEDGSTKDSTFSNWVETALKLKSTAYVQDGDETGELQSAFDLTLRSDGKPDQTIHVLRNGDSWYARGDFTRGLVKLSKGPAEDATADVDDILEGREPPEKAKPSKPPPALTRPPASDDAKPKPMRPGGPPAPPGLAPRPG